MDIDDLLKFHASDIEEDAARLDVMPCPVYPPAGRFFLSSFVAVALFLSFYSVFYLQAVCKRLKFRTESYWMRWQKNSQLLISDLRHSIDIWDFLEMCMVLCLT
jgi:hypothetical protein